MVKVEEVSKYYGARRALDGVSFEIGQGEVVGLLGLNGAGKTTMLRILSGGCWPSSGRISVNGHDGLHNAAALRAQVGFLPDRPPLYGDMPVRGMLSYAAGLSGLRGADLARRVDATLETCALTAVAGDRVEQLSLGYRQRVGIAQAIVHRPALLILDEPISGLDPGQIVAARGLIRQLAEEHTVLLSSHILPEIAQTCDRLLVLHQGQLIAQGDEDSLRAKLPVGRFVVEALGEATQGLRVAEATFGISDIQVGTGSAPGQYALQARAVDTETRAALVKAMVTQGQRVHRITETTGDGLEGVFLELTRKRESPA